MSKPNMTLRQLEQWTRTEAFQQYRLDRGHQTVDAVIRRTKRYLRGTASEDEKRKVESFIARMKNNSAGQRKYGNGSGAVSAKTASLRNWGYDPTGRY